jgi:hypothetical protein
VRNDDAAAVGAAWHPRKMGGITNGAQPYKPVAAEPLRCNKNLFYSTIEFS